MKLNDGLNAMSSDFSKQEFGIYLNIHYLPIEISELIKAVFILCVKKVTFARKETFFGQNWRMIEFFMIFFIEQLNEFPGNINNIERGQTP